MTQRATSTTRRRPQPLDPAVAALIDALALNMAAEDHARESQQAPPPQRQ